MIPYSFHVAILLAVCFVFYKLLLQKETYYRLNRGVLLTCLVLAFALPLIPVPRQFSLFAPAEVSSAVSKNNVREEQLTWNDGAITAVPITQSGQPQKAAAPVAARPIQTSTGPRALFLQPANLLKWAVILYWCVAAAFGANFLVQLSALVYQAYRKPAIQDGIYRIVELDDDKAPCSFGNNIFINPTKYDWDTYNQILMHEKVHIQQGHSFDLLLAELMLVVQWFNPFAWLYRKEVENNLEFLTDNEVLNQNELAIADYQMSLLRVSVPNITTNYNQSLLKKRIIMMNAKRSNVHTMWKYFMLVPLLVVLVCGLNKPVALSSPALQQQVRYKISRTNDIDMSHGTWFATIKNDKIQIEFKADDNDENHSWSSSSTFSLSDFPSLPRGAKADFTLTREAGTVVFNGNFDGDQGIGHYKFTPNKDYVAYMAKQNLSNDENDTYFSFFISNVKREYVEFLKKNGFDDITRGQVLAMSSLKVDASYISYWKKLGYNDLKPQQLISLKALKVDSAYVNDIRRAGYTDLTVQQLISFKSQHITGDYINGLKKATVKAPGSAEAPAMPTPREIITSKAMHIDSAFVAGTRRAGYADLNYSQMGSMKSMNITPEYIKSFEAVGYKDIPYNTLLMMKSGDVTPADVKAYKDLGYADGDLPHLLMMKRQGVTPEYVKSFESVGFKNLSVSSLMMLRSQKLTPEYIKSFQDAGYKDASVNTYWMLKQQGITPEYLKSLHDLGYTDISLKNVYAFRGLTPEYIRSFQDAGYKNVSLQQLSILKHEGITPEFAAGFNKLGFTDIKIMDLARLKMAGITPEFITEMKQKGFDSKDINKYIQLKNFNSDSDGLPRRKQLREPAVPSGQN